jgi:proteic killer suppression protein
MDRKPAKSAGFLFVWCPLVTTDLNRLEALGGDRKGSYSIRISQQWRLCFEWREDGPHNVEIVDYHR